MEERARPVETVVSLWRGRLPPPGAPERPWGYRDVVDGLRGARLPATFVVRHGGEEDPDPEVRASYATLVTVREDGAIGVDDRICVERRILSPVLRAERALSREVGRGAGAALGAVEKGGEALAQRAGGTTGAVIRGGTGAVVGGASWAGRTARGFVRGVVEAPDWLFSSAGAADAYLKGPRTRRAFVRSLLRPQQLSREGKGVALFVSAVTVAALIVVATLVIALAAPAYAVPWRTLLGFFLRGVVGVVLLPLFPELSMLEVAQKVNLPAAVLTGAVAMTVGAWLTLFVGDEVYAALRKLGERRAWLARGLDKAEAFAKRFGFWTAFILLGIPLGPDTPVFYALASVRVPMAKYLLGTFLGGCVRFTLFYFLFRGYYL